MHQQRCNQDLNFETDIW